MKYGLIIITILVFLVAYLLGLMIVQVVDQRLSDISIKMPEIRVTAPLITHHQPQPQPQHNRLGNASTLPEQQYYQLKSPISSLKPFKQSLPNVFQTGGSIGLVGSNSRSGLIGARECPVPPTRAKYNPDNYKSEAIKINKPTATRLPDLHPIRKSL